MSKHIDITGQRFGQLVAVEIAGRNKARLILWLCRCDCGATKSVSGKLLRDGRTTSCGHLAIEQIVKRSLRHGASRRGKVTPEYRAWSRMKERCMNPRCKRFRDYGGRGISICERWLSFDNFLLDMGVRSHGCSLDRINNDGIYEPSNCRWATRSEQMLNRRKFTRCPQSEATKQKIRLAALDQWRSRRGIPQVPHPVPTPS
jgi:hypothetical protein